LQWWKQPTEKLIPFWLGKNKKSLIGWASENLPSVKVGKFHAKRLSVRNGKDDINKNFYNEVISKAKYDEHYIERLQLAKKAHIWIKTAEKVDIVKSTHHSDAVFDIYEYNYRGVVYLLECKETGMAVSFII
jgi:translation initiation factor 2 beta subunit (eIF-2beta)/eIF-5